MPISTSAWYAAFAAREAAGQSPTYERLALGVAADMEVITHLDTLPEDKRQPNLLFASVRALGGPVDAVEPFTDWVLSHWQALVATMRTKRTQTNEPRRSATLLPWLTQIEGPLALLEVGASAGLCLYPDRWQYRYGGALVGDSDAPLLTCAPIGPFEAPTRLPDVVWRADIDLNPLRAADPDDVRWLEALIWPEHSERLGRLHDAIAMARREPALLVAGDLNDELPAVAAQLLAMPPWSCSTARS